MLRQALSFAVLLLVGGFVSGFAQGTGNLDPGRVGPRPLLPLEEEIRLARSAAPPGVSDSSTVYVLTDSGYAIGVQGTSGVSCYVSRSWPRSLEPHCFDTEGASTIMPMEMRRVELLHRSTAPDLVEKEISAGLLEGRFRLPRRPAMSWMMSSAQRLISDEGQAAGNWKPHLMIYYPNLGAAETGLGGTPDLRHAILVDPGKPTSNIMIVVTEFIQPRGGSPSP
jgi:hypothetical protein